MGRTFLAFAGKFNSLEWLKNKYVPLVLTTVFYFVFYLNVPGMSGDELAVYHRVANDGTPLLDFLKQRYEGWSSRLLIEGVMLLVLRCPFLVWKISTGLFLAILLWSVYYIFFHREKTPVVWVYCSFMVLCDFHSLSTSAGWVATTLNYIWPVSLLFLSLIPIKLIETDGKSNKKCYLCFIPAICFAINQEIFAVVAFFVVAVFTVKSIISKSKEYYYFILLLLSLVSLFFVLFCPGNSNRFSGEVKTWYPNFSEISLMHKVADGVILVFNYIAVKKPLIFLLSSLVVVLIVYFDERRKPLFRIVSLVPLSGSLFAFVFIRFSKGFFGKLHRMIGLDDYFGGMVQDGQHYAIKYFLITAFVCIIFFSFLLSVFFVFKYSKKTIVIFLIIISGFISQMVLSFSPTIYASDIRTATLLFITSAIAGTFLFSQYSKDKKVEQTVYLSLILVILFLGAASGLHQLSRL